MGMDKKDLILEAAAECFTAYGYEKTSMSDIGDRVGLNKASLYYHYRDKLALFDAMVQAKRSVHRESLRRKLEEQPAGIPGIVTFLCGEIDFVEKLSVNFLAPPDSRKGSKDDTSSVFQTIIEEDIRKLLDLIGESRLSGLFEGRDPEVLARQTLLIARGLLMADCPLDLAKAERAEGYERVRNDIREIIPVFLRGAGG